MFKRSTIMLMYIYLNKLRIINIDINQDESNIFCLVILQVSFGTHFQTTEKQIDIHIQTGNSR